MPCSLQPWPAAWLRAWQVKLRSRGLPVNAWPRLQASRRERERRLRGQAQQPKPDLPDALLRQASPGYALFQKPQQPERHEFLKE